MQHMNISIDTIYEFHRVRTGCHIATVNYFAELLGYHFPEHDNDKSVEPMRTGYAYTNYAKYHPKYNLPENYTELFHAAHKTHHEHATHHVQFYGGDVSKIPDVHVIEMVCDWSAANFEQVSVMGDCEYNTTLEWFDAKMAHLNWTDAQMDIIHSTLDKIAQNRDDQKIMKIWSPVLEIADL